MKETICSSPLFGITLSVFAYEAGVFLHKKARTPLVNPLLVAVVLIVALLRAFEIPLEDFQRGGGLIAVFLAPATAVLAVSVYRQLGVLKANLPAILAGCLAGTAASMGSAYGLSRLFGLDNALTASMVPKSVTTPIAMEVSKALGGLAPVTVAAVIFTGILGAVFAPTLLKLLHIQDPVVAGVAIGTSSHAVGTTKAVELGEVEGAMSSVAIGVAGILTVLLSLLFQGLF